MLLVSEKDGSKSQPKGGFLLCNAIVVAIVDNKFVKTVTCQT